MTEHPVLLQKAGVPSSRSLVFDGKADSFRALVLVDGNGATTGGFRACKPLSAEHAQELLDSPDWVEVPNTSGDEVLLFLHCHSND